MKNISFVLLFTLLFVGASCSSDDGIKDEPNQFVTYDGTIKAIMSTNCTTCHFNPPINGAPMPLLSRDQVMEAVQNRDLIGRVEDGSMPPGNAPDLTAEEVQALKDWRIGNFKE